MAKIVDKGEEADGKLPDIELIKVAPIPTQVFEAGNRVQHRKTFEVRRVQSVDGETLLFEPNGVTDDAVNWVVLAEKPQDLTDTTAREQQDRQAASHPTSASNREFQNATALIRQIEQIPLSSLGHNQREQYAEALALTGRHDVAATITNDGIKKAEYLSAHNAIWKDDDLTCKCKPLKTVEMKDGQAIKAEHSNMFPLGKAFSHKQNAMVNIIKCNQCGFSNSTNG